jgi:diguanylate cyclase (GGDEF)-like protein
MSYSSGQLAHIASDGGRAAWLERLVQAGSPVEVAALMLDMVLAVPGCDSAVVLWWLEGARDYQSHPPHALTADELAVVRSALEGESGGFFIGDGLMAWRLFASDPAVLLLSFDPALDPRHLREALPAALQLAIRQLRRTLELADLQHSHKQLARSENLQRALFAISDLSGAELDMPDMLRGIHGIVSTLMYAENFFIVRYNAERDTLRFLYYADVEDTDKPDPHEEIPFGARSNTLTWHVISDGRALMGSSDELREQVSGFTLFGPDSYDWLGVPMMREGVVGGALVVQTYDADIHYSAEDRALLEFVGSHILTALERKQDKDDLEERVRSRTLELAEVNRGLQQEVQERQRAERLQAALFHIAQLATEDIDQGEFYRRVHVVVGELLNAQNFFIALLSDDQQWLEFPYFVDERVSVVKSRPLGRGLSEYVLRHGEPLMGRRADIDALGQLGEVELQHPSTRAVCWLGVPLLVADEVIGLVVVQSYSESVVYTQADQELLSFAALQIANSIYRRRSAASLHEAYGQLEQRVQERTQELRQQIMQRERIQEQLRHQVMHDPLTGLPNRGYLRDRLDQALARMQREPGLRCALLYIDVDRFKIINDSLGHLAGDKVLREVAARLLTCVRDPDVVARLSGDEFAILLEDVNSPRTATQVAQRVLDALSAPLMIAGKDLQPTASMGIAVGDSSYGTADEMLRDADIALYRAKELGRKRYELFDEAMARNLVDELSMEGELRQALQQDEFEPYFQPVARLDTGEVVGYEALLRWNHPQRGLLAPGDFLKVAHDSGYIEAIDWRLFELACARLQQLAEQRSFLTLNVSALHLRHEHFDRSLIALLERVGLPPGRVVVEVTEGALLDDPERVRATLERLRGVGVGAALDDFGTGYSSLSYLHSLPLRLLKIDRAFVQALDQGQHTNSTTVVEAILALARALSIRVIAEGIETEAQRDTLQAMGCELGQGFLLGRPAPIGDWLERAAATDLS